MYINRELVKDNCYKFIQELRQTDNIMSYSYYMRQSLIASNNIIISYEQRYKM